MKLILRADIDNLGRLGDVVTVKPGYGRNYLVPQGLAMLATRANTKVFELERKKLQARVDALKAKAMSLSEKLAATHVMLKVRVGDGNRLYGAVTTTHIAQALADEGIELDRRKIIQPEPIRALGTYTLDVKLHQDVDTKLNLSVVRHDWKEGDPITEEDEKAMAAEIAAEDLSLQQEAQPQETQEAAAETP